MRRRPTAGEMDSTCALVLKFVHGHLFVSAVQGRQL